MRRIDLASSLNTDDKVRDYMAILRKATSAALFTVLLLSCSTVAAVDLAITNTTLIDGTGGAPKTGVTIVIRNGLIESVAPADSINLHQGVTIIDGRGKYVIPGLADMHVHFSTGAPISRRHNTTEAVLARALYYGVTSILNLGGSDGSTDSIRSLRQRRTSGSLQAPFIYGTGGHLTLQGSHPVYTIFPPTVRKAADSLALVTPMSDPVDLYPLGIGVSLVRSEDAARKAVRERAEGGMDAIKITVESGPTPFGDNHPQMSVEMIRAIVNEASQHDLKVFAHATSLDELEAVLEGGASGTVHTPQNIPLPDISVADRMATNGFALVPTLSLFATPGTLDDPFLRETVSDEEFDALMAPEFIDRVRGRWECCAEFDDVLKNVGMFHRRGVVIVLGTDTGNPFIFPGYSVHQELEFLVRAGLSAMEAIQAATLHAAEMINAEQEFGSIEAGKRADLLILAANPLEDISNTRLLEVVISSGQVVDRETLLHNDQ